MVSSWVNLIVAEYFTDLERTVFLRGLAGVDALAKDLGGVPLAMTSPQQRKRVMDALDHRNIYERFVFFLDRSSASTRVINRILVYIRLKGLVPELAPRARAYSRLKELVIHGYFTSERVQKEVLRTQIIPGRFDGAAPLPMIGQKRHI